MFFKCRKKRVCRMKGLHPHFARTGVPCIAASAACGLHQQTEQTLGRAKVTGKKCAVGVDACCQRDMPEVVALGDHLRADQHVNLARVYAGQLRLERAFEPRAVGINSGDAHSAAIRSFHLRQKFSKVLFQPLCAAPNGGNIDVAAARACARHTLGKTAVVAAQRAVDFVEHTVGAAMRAFAFPAAVMAGQHRRVAATV